MPNDREIAAYAHQELGQHFLVSPEEASVLAVGESADLDQLGRSLKWSEVTRINGDDSCRRSLVCRVSYEWFLSS
jgi:hypothetical protein